MIDVLVCDLMVGNVIRGKVVFFNDEYLVLLDLKLCCYEMFRRCLFDADCKSCFRFS